MTPSTVGRGTLPLLRLPRGCASQPVYGATSTCTLTLRRIEGVPTNPNAKPTVAGL